MAGLPIPSLTALLWPTSAHCDTEVWRRSVLARMRLDKKNLAGRLRLVLWRGIGRAEVVPDVDESAVLDVLSG